MKIPTTIVNKNVYSAQRLIEYSDTSLAGLLMRLLLSLLSILARLALSSSWSSLSVRMASLASGRDLLVISMLSISCVLFSISNEMDLFLYPG